ncbi:MAG: Ig-like domain-containing protein [Peptococcaceae bacterium]|jgi:hypothetical protein|nr:Ig-like domain-containing protein [Peptococcaceae bacterium]
MKRLRLWMVICICAVILCAAPAPAVFADSVTDTLAVYVGYYGGPYYLKQEYHWTELDDLYGGALDTHEAAYSYYSGSRVAVDSARGFYLSDFLQYAGVDLNSTASLDFYTKDHTSGAYRSFTKYAMLDAPRYYFPNMTVDEATEELAPRGGGSLWDGALQVETMMALEDNWEWDAEGTNFTNPGTSSRFRLLFGQLEPAEAMTSASAKYVYAIYVTFSGMPILTAEEQDLSVKIGSDYRVTVNVAAEDSLLDEYVKDNLVWSSNNTDAVEVDMYGNLKVKQNGEAVVTVTFGETSASVVVAVDGEADGGSGGDSGNGGGLAERENGGGSPENENGEGGGNAESGEPQSSESRDGAEAVSFSENSAGVYILSSELMARTEYAEWVNSILRHEVTTDSAAGGVANWRDGPMEDGAEALRVQITAYGSWPVYAGAGALFLLGLFGGAASFKFHMGRGGMKN